MGHDRRRSTKVYRNSNIGEKGKSPEVRKIMQIETNIINRIDGKQLT